MIYRALKQRRTAESLASFVRQYCEDHYKQVCAAVFNHEIAERANFVGRSRQANTSGLASVPPLYSFYVAITAGQALELFDSWAHGKRSAAPVGIEEISRLAADVLSKTLHLETAEAESVIEGVLAEIEALDAAAQAAKGKSDADFAQNIAAMDRHTARIVLVYCAAEKTADQIFDAWRADPTAPPPIDIETATEYATLLGAIRDTSAADEAQAAPAPVQPAPQATAPEPAPAAPPERAPTPPAPKKAAAEPAPQPAMAQPAPEAAPPTPADRAPAAPTPAKVVVTPPPPMPAPQSDRFATAEPAKVAVVAEAVAPAAPPPEAAPQSPPAEAAPIRIMPHHAPQPATEPAAPQAPEPAVQFAAADGGWPNLKLAG